MINQIISDVMLKNYEGKNFVLRQKARVLSIIVMILIAVMFFTYTHIFIYDSGMIVVAPVTFTVIGCFFILYLIRKGYYNVSGHILLIGVMVASWTTMFIDIPNLLFKTDTIIFIAAGLCLTSLIIDKEKKFIVIYLCCNIIVLVAFCFHLSSLFRLTFDHVAEYFLDNVTMFILIAMISYQVVWINQKALDIANEATEEARKEALKNKELSQTLEQNVVQRTEDLVKKNEELQAEIKVREQAEERLKTAQRELIDHAHKAGMAEIAADTLHNIGNVLNSVKTSAHLIKASIEECPTEDFSKTCRLIESHSDNLQEFMAPEAQGSKVLDYLLKLERGFDENHRKIGFNIERLAEKIETITQVIMAQQTHAGAHFLTESLNLHDIMEYALALVPELISNQGIQLEKDFEDLPEIKGQKAKLLHVLVNLLKNAAQATMSQGPNQKLVKVSMSHQAQEVVIEVKDSGYGIPTENLGKVFTHGFTTKEDGSGFGLHSCANYIQEMGGTINVESEGVGKGALFRVQLPVS